MKMVFYSQGLSEQTLKVLQLMEAEGIEPNLIMLNVLINAFGTAGRYREALSIYHHMKENVSLSILVTRWILLLIRCFFVNDCSDNVLGVSLGYES